MTLQQLLCLALLLALCSNTGHAAAAQMGLLVPLYIYPSSSVLTNHYQKVADAVSAGVAAVVVLNPNNGDDAPTYCNSAAAFPASVTNADWRAAVTLLHNGKVPYIGYTHSTYAARNLSAIYSVIDAYVACWGVSGFFIDETASDTSTATYNYYHAIYSYVQSKDKALQVWLNPGTTVPETFTNIATNIITSERNYPQWLTYTAAAYAVNYPAAQFTSIVELTAEANAIATVDLAASRHFAWVYVTNLTYAEGLPSYWSTVVAHVQQQYTRPGCPTGPDCKQSSAHHPLYAAGARTMQIVLLQLLGLVVVLRSI